MYGVADYAMIRKKNGWFVDRTAKIRDLEQTAYAVFLRPRRFGKSLLTAILEAYYDVACAERFDSLFSGTDIGGDPTEERNSYLVLSFDFSAVEKSPETAQQSFSTHVCGRIDAFARKYAGRIGEASASRILAARNSTDKMNVLFDEMKGTENPIYVIIDEYDNFTNTILAESGEAAYELLCHGGGFFKQFFTIVKSLTTSLDAPLKRLFITGVSPVTRDDVTSGFNIGTNISLMPQFSDFTGFRHDDLHAITDYYAAHCGFDAEKAYDTAIRWYDNYRFGSASAPSVANTTVVLSFFNHLWQTKQFPKNLIDSNLRTDYAKIRHLVTLDRRLNGNFHVLENLVAGGRLSEPLVESFQAHEMSEKENFTSLLYWLGITTITGEDFETVEFGIPNETLKHLAAKMIPDAYSDIYRIDGRIFDINKALVVFARRGEWQGFVGILSQIVKENFAVRDAVEGEKVVQSTLVALLVAAGGPYFVKHEREVGGGFYDIALEPQLLRWPEIAHAALIEMKYVKAGDPAPTPEQLEKIKSEAIVQLDQYSADPALIAAWHIGGRGATALPQAATGSDRSVASPKGTAFGEAALSPLHDGMAATSAALPCVALHRLVLVFHGGDCVLSEEV